MMSFALDQKISNLIVTRGSLGSILLDKNLKNFIIQMLLQNKQ